MAAERGVLFDVDGTLVDTVYLHTTCWSRALREGGHTVPMALIHRSIGMGSAELLDHLIPDRDRSGDDALTAAHGEHYKRYWNELNPLPGAAELMRACARSGLQVVLASSAMPEELDALRKALDADDVISATTSGGDAESGKPTPDILQVALEQTGLAADSVVFVGDSVWDGKSAAALDITFVGLRSGGTGDAELEAAGAVEIYRDPADLLAAFDESALGRLQGDSSY